MWISDEVLTGGGHTASVGKRGHPRTYSETAILTMATLQEVSHLPLRQTEGLLGSIGKLRKLEIPVPDHSTLSHRRATLEVDWPHRHRGEALHVVVDSTGLKVFGEGDWKVRQHGYTRRHTWRKLHLGGDAATGEIVAAVVTTNGDSDSQVLPDLLEQVDDPLTQVSGDGGYDRRNCYEAIRAREATATIPPQRNAKIWQHGNTRAERLGRDQNLRRIRQVGRAEFAKLSGV
jgi:IS5 family transposase